MYKYTISRASWLISQPHHVHGVHLLYIRHYTNLHQTGVEKPPGRCALWSQCLGVTPDITGQMLTAISMGITQSSKRFVRCRTFSSVERGSEIECGRQRAISISDGAEEEAV